jgi:hypothetical protein
LTGIPTHPTLSIMPKGPQGQKRPADVIGAAIRVAKIATGEIKDEESVAPKRAIGGKRGGKARAENLNAEQRREIARKGAAARWGKE